MSVQKPHATAAIVKILVCSKCVVLACKEGHSLVVVHERRGLCSHARQNDDASLTALEGVHCRNLNHLYLCVFSQPVM